MPFCSAHLSLYQNVNSNSRLVRFVEHLAHHVEIALSAGGLVGLVHAVVEFLEERGVLVVVGVVVDVLHGIEAEPVHAHAYPLVGRFGDGLERPGLLGLGGLAVVEVGECRRPEVRMVHRRQRELYVGRVGRAVRHQGEGLPEPDDRPVVGGAVFGACGPRRGRGADEESPVGIEVERQFVTVAAPGVEAFARAVAEIEVFVVRAALRIVRIRGIGRFGNGHRRAVGICPVEHELEAPGGTRPRVGREPLSGIVACGAFRGDLVDPPGRDVGLRVFGEDIAVTVRAPFGRGGRFEPRVVFARMVEHVIQVDPDAAGMGRVDECPQVGVRPEGGVDRLVVEHVVTVVRSRRMDRREPYGRGAECVDVVEPPGQPRQVAHLVAVAVGKAVYQQLVAYVGAFAVVPRIGLGDDLLALEILGGIAALCHGDDDRIAARGGEGECRAALRAARIGGDRNVERGGGPARRPLGRAPRRAVALRERPRPGVGLQFDQLASAPGVEFERRGGDGEQTASLAGGRVLAARDGCGEEQRQQQVENSFHL